MRTVQEHLSAFLASVRPQPPLAAPPGEAVGCILAEDVIATNDLPHADLAGIDGYALRSTDITQATPTQPTTLSVLEEVRPGSVERFRLVQGTAVRISSGAPLPLE